MGKVVAIAFGIALVAVAPRAHAFCGFYISGADASLENNATQVVLMREGTRTVLSMQNNYKGPPSDFAMVVPVPAVLQKENVRTLPRDVFERVNKLAAPRLVEYWEQDPCHVLEYEDRMAVATGAMPRGAIKEKAADKGGVTVEAQFAAGEYDIVILSATDSGGLDKWLRANKYKIPAGAEPHLRPYVQKGSKFFVAKVDVSKVKFVGGEAELSPLRFFYDSPEFSLPVRLGLINSGGTQDLVVHILARGQRYEVANYKNATIPTNLEVRNETRDRYGEFYAALFDETLKKNPGAVITEYSWDASSCDPCPTPALRPQEISTLGSNVLHVPMPQPKKKTTKSKAKPSGKKGDPLDLIVKDKAAIAKPMPPRRFRGGFVLTRLHARYSPTTMKDDLVFKKAGPIVGGREFVQTAGKLEEGSRPGRINNFQGRYAIRHKWTGEIKCENPVRGRWGGPPAGQKRPEIAAADDSAKAKRGAITLASMVAEPVPELGLVPKGQPAVAGSSQPQKAGKEAKTSKNKDSGCQSGGVAVLMILLLAGALLGGRRRCVG